MAEVVYAGPRTRASVRLPSGRSLVVSLTNAVGAPPPPVVGSPVVLHWEPAAAFAMSVEPSPEPAPDPAPTPDPTPER